MITYICPRCNLPGFPSAESGDNICTACANHLRFGHPDLKGMNIVHDSEKVTAALSIIERFGGIDGGHHKQWVLDQVVRALVDDYPAWVKDQKAGEDGPETYDWDEGIAP